MFTTLDRKELLSYYRTSDILFITPLKDGMNLVVKEYCVSNLEENGVLILSEFAGSAAEFKKNALLVNPHDIIGMAEAIRFAFTMPMNERQSHMRKMRQIIKKNDIYRWVDTFSQAAIEKNLDSFPILPEYIPQADDTFIKGMLENR
jgi:trehalose 6-phosphate synthase